MSHEIDLSNKQNRIHILAIGGAGMSGIAQILASLGHRISGSDVASSKNTERLKKLGISIAIGHDSAVDDEVDFVGYSTAIRPDNPELLRWQNAGVPTHHRFDLLRAIGNESKTLSVSGTHGKTTTSSMLQSILEAAGWDPNYLIGSNLAGKETGTRWSGSEWFVLEADESDATFLAPARSGSIITNVEADHLDFYGSMEKLVEAFVQFAEETDGPVVICGDDEGSAELAKAIARRTVTYGDSGDFDYRISGVAMDDRGSSWRLSSGGHLLDLSIRTAGIHLVRNASGAAALALELGASAESVIAGLKAWRGTGRRFESRGSTGGIEFRDDYAHLPTEVKAVLSTAHAMAPRRIVAVLQPHRYSRTAEVGSGFGSSLSAADVVVVTDIYAAGEDPIDGVSPELIVDSIKSDAPGVEVHFVSGRDALVETMLSVLREGDLCLTLGAGDITTLPTQLREALVARGAESDV